MVPSLVQGSLGRPDSLTGLLQSLVDGGTSGHINTGGRTPPLRSALPLLICNLY